MTLNNHNLVLRMLKARQLAVNGTNGNAGNGNGNGGAAAGSSAVVSQSLSTATAASDPPVSSATTQMSASLAQSSSPTASQTSKAITSTPTSQTPTTSTSSTSSSGITTKLFTATGVTTGPGLVQTSSFANVSPASKANTSVGAVVGGVLGAIALLLLLLGIFYYRRRRRQGLASETHEVKPFTIPEHQHPNFTQLPSSFAAQRSFATAMSKNTATRTTNQQLDYRPPGVVGKRGAVSQQTPAAVLAPNPQQSTSTTMITNPALDPPASMPDLSPRVFIHQDSGIRLPEQGSDVVEYPPIYTPG